jgi:hypothetical protein
MGTCISGDGAVMMAAAFSDLMYMSYDGGNSWITRFSYSPWHECASSYNASKLLVGGLGTYLYIGG